MATFIANLACAECGQVGAYNTDPPECPECKAEPKPVPGEQEDGC